jgi:hypothetical protein
MCWCANEKMLLFKWQMVLKWWLLPLLSSGEGRGEVCFFVPEAIAARFDNFQNLSNLKPAVYRLTMDHQQQNSAPKTGILRNSVRKRIGHWRGLEGQKTKMSNFKQQTEGRICHFCFQWVCFSPSPKFRRGPGWGLFFLARASTLTLPSLCHKPDKPLGEGIPPFFSLSLSKARQAFRERVGWGLFFGVRASKGRHPVGARPARHGQTLSRATTYETVALRNNTLKTMIFW